MTNILENTRILAVDDEPDILETLEDLLAGIKGLTIETAEDYDGGFHLLRSWTYDAVILDIMGVRGFDLLNTSVHRGFPTIMLTAHALSPESLKRSIELGARAYLPKEKMDDIVLFLEDVVSLSRKNVLGRMMDRLGPYFTRRFGKDWRESEKSFWEKVESGKYDEGPVILT
ncbi:MAG: response regulator [Desulfobacteraceae bacterium]|nr:response regulator [Desulfobacteraceae bacterium]